MADKFKENNQALIDAIHQLMEYPSMETERNVYLSLPQAVFLMPAIVDDKDRMEVLEGRIIRVEPGTPLRIAQFTSEEGNQNLYPAFTSLEEVDKWNVDLEREDIHLLEMDMDSFINMLAENQEVSGFVIDPFTFNLVLAGQQLGRYQEILKEEMDRESLINPMSRLMDELRYNPQEETEEKIYNAFQNFRFLMPIYVENTEDIVSVTDEQVAEIKEGVAMNVVPLENESGERVFPVFTDLYEVRRSGIDLSNEHNYLVEMTMDAMEDLVNHSDDILGFAINPFTHNVVISDAQFARYHEIENQTPAFVLSQDEMEIRESMMEEEEDKEALRREAEAISNITDHNFEVKGEVNRKDLEQVLSKEMDSLGNIHKAYLMLKVYDNKERFLVIVDKERDGKSVFGELRDAAFPKLDFEDQIEFMSYNEEEAKLYTKDIEPFYERSQKRGLFGFLKRNK